ncbi:MAG: ABC transporter substrate-binding protein [Rhodospirillales bacterium]|nr:ABC transporter substrate-binding protein [Alphaproteobacteria bacterium]MCY4431320.1 ABC transporter substrate-binding protein [Rhodospirillales bacterium]
MKRFTTALAAAALAVAAGTASVSAGEELRIGVEGAYPPFSWKEADGSLKGFDIDITFALCEKMGRECTLVEQDWDGMIPALLARKYDAIVASMSITEERKKRVDFTVKYYNTPARFVAAEGSDLDVSPAGLAGKAVGVQRGTTHQCFMEKLFPEADLRLYQTQEEVFLDLAAGRLDAQFSDALQADEGFLKLDAGKGFAFVGGPQYDLECHGEGAGVALRKGEDELLQAFNAAILAIREDGTYKSINDKYFDFDVYGD